MTRKESLKRRMVLWLHRWLVNLQLLKDPWRDRHDSDPPSTLDLEQITIQNVSCLSVEQPGPITIEDPMHVVKDHSEQASIEDPNRVIIEGNLTLVIDHPATVTIQASAPIEAVNGSQPFSFLYPDTAKFTDIKKITINGDNNN